MDKIRLFLSYIYDVILDSLKKIFSKIVYIIIILLLILCVGVFIYNKTVSNISGSVGTMTELKETTETVTKTLNDIKKEYEVKRQEIVNEVEKNNYEYEQTNVLYSDTIGRVSDVKLNNKLNINSSFADINIELEKIKTKFEIANVFLEKHSKMSEKYEGNTMVYKGEYQDKFREINSKAYDIAEENIKLLKRMEYLESISTVEGKIENYTKQSVNINPSKIIGGYDLNSVDYESLPLESNLILEPITQPSTHYHTYYKKYDFNTKEDGVGSLYTEVVNVVNVMSEKYQLSQSDLENFKIVRVFHSNETLFKVNGEIIRTYIDFDNNVIYFNDFGSFERNDDKKIEENNLKNDYKDLINSIEKAFEHYILVKIVGVNLEEGEYLKQDWSE